MQRKGHRPQQTQNVTESIWCMSVGDSNWIIPSNIVFQGWTFTFLSVHMQHFPITACRDLTSEGVEGVYDPGEFKLGLWSPRNPLLQNIFSISQQSTCSTSNFLHAEKHRSTRGCERGEGKELLKGMCCNLFLVKRLTPDGGNSSVTNGRFVTFVTLEMRPSGVNYITRRTMPGWNEGEPWVEPR